MGRRDSLEQKPFWLLLITFEVIDDANVADVDQIDIEADDLSNKDDTTADPDEDGDTKYISIFSIANDYTSDDENTLAEKDDYLLAVHTRRTATNQRDAAEDFLLHEKQWSVSCKTSSLTRWTATNGTLTNIEDQTFFYLMSKT